MNQSRTSVLMLYLTEIKSCILHALFLILEDNIIHFSKETKKKVDRI